MRVPYGWLISARRGALPAQARYLAMSMGTVGTDP